MLLADITQGGVTFDPVPAFVFAGSLCAVFLGWGIGIWWVTYGWRASASRRTTQQPQQYLPQQFPAYGYPQQQYPPPGNPQQQEPPAPYPQQPYPPQPYPPRGTQ
ncbi:MAG: hypothetical protein ACR2LF_05565 [Jatrophihabitantaceae bacterium]